MEHLRQVSGPVASLRADERAQSGRSDGTMTMSDTSHSALNNVAGADKGPATISICERSAPETVPVWRRWQPLLRSDGRCVRDAGTARHRRAARGTMGPHLVARLCSIERDAQRLSRARLYHKRSGPLCRCAPNEWRSW